MSSEATDVLALADRMREDATTTAREYAAGMAEQGRGLAALAAEARDGRLERDRIREEWEDVASALIAVRPLLAELGRYREDTIVERIREHGDARHREGVAEGRRQVEEEASVQLAIRRSTARAVANPLIAVAIAGLLIAILTACATVVYRESGATPPHIEAAP